MGEPDVVVVGGGLVGTSVAYELACEGAGVVLVDAGDAGCASSAGAGIVSPETWHDPDSSWWRFGCDAARHLTELVARLRADGVDPGPDAFSQCGSLMVALAEHEDPWFAEAAAVITARSPEVTEIDPAEAGRRFPVLAPVWRSLSNPSARRVDGRRLTEALRAACRARGVAVRHGTATGVTDGDAVTAVDVDGDRVSCDSVVLAGGAWSGTWGPVLRSRLPVTPLKGQIVHVTSPDAPGSAAWPIVQPILNFYLVPWPGGRVACGGTFEADEGFDVRPTASGLADLLRECVKIAPGLAAATFTEVRVGLRPATPDERPLLGPLPGWTNVHVCTGHGAEGLALGPYSAALVAAGMLGGQRDAIAPFDPARFT